jgi:hypothetical protein
MTKASENKELQSIQDQIRKDLATLKDRVEPPSGFTISTKGKTFTLPDGTSNPGPMRCVIVDWTSANLYFEGIYNPKAPKPPVCWAIGDIPKELQPSDNAPKQQHTTCKGCPQNEWGSAGGDSKGKACKNTRRLLIAPADADETFSGWVIVVSPTGLKHFDKYVNTLADLDKHPIEVVTEIAFEPTEAYPSLRFKPAGQNDNLTLFWKLKEAGQEILHMEPQPEEEAA